MTTAKVEQEAHLGYIVGNIPSTVRFVCFKGCVSRESVQAMCILLKKRNAAFIAPTRSETETLVHTLMDVQQQPVSSPAVSPRSPQLSWNSHVVMKAAARSRPLKGLLGLSITHSGKCFPTNDSCKLFSFSNLFRFIRMCYLL